MPGRVADDQAGGLGRALTQKGDNGAKGQFHHQGLNEVRSTGRLKPDGCR